MSAAKTVIAAVAILSIGLVVYKVWQNHTAAAAMAAVGVDRQGLAKRGEATVVIGEQLHAQVGSSVQSIQVALGSIHRSLNVRFGTKLVRGTLTLGGPEAAHVVAARAIITYAADDIGHVLMQENSPAFYHMTVGGSSGDRQTPEMEPTSFTLSPTGPSATLLQSVKGYVEVFLPERDPDSMVVVDPLPPKFGVRIESPAFAEAGITLVVYDRASTEKFCQQDGDNAPQEFDSGPWFAAWPRREPMFPGLPPAVQAAIARQRNRMSAGMPSTAIGVGILDPNGRLLPVEFEDKAGDPLDYNHDGFYHSSSGLRDGKRFDGYDLGIRFPADGKMVCWVMTDNSLEKIPFELRDVPLPPK